MKNYVLTLLTVWSLSAAGQTVLWTEDFEGEPNGAVTGTAGGAIGGSWSVISTPPSGSGSFSKQGTGFQNRFTINGTGNGEGVWSSGLINIASYAQVAIEITLVNYYSTDLSDYIRVYYKLNGGAEVLFGELEGGNSYDISSTASIILTGATVEIIVRARENSPGNTPESFFLFPRMLRFDDVRLVSIGTLYSRANGDWTNGNTWSVNASGTPACGCTPNQSTNVVIRHTVNMNSGGDAINVTIQNGGTLRFTGNHELSIHRGGTVNVNAGGSLNRNGFNTSMISFSWDGVTNGIVANGPFDIGYLQVNASATLNIGGTGSMNIQNDFRVYSAATITNNKTSGNLTVGGNLVFNTTNARFTNGHSMTIGNLLVNDNQDDGNRFTNLASATLTTGNITVNNATFEIQNFGTINHTGNYPNNTLDNSSAFYNRSTGTWNWSATGITPDPSITMVLNASEAGNTFNYNGAGTQSVLAIPYHHLQISTSGTKTLAGAIDVNGNLTIQNAAILASANNTITLGGDWTVLNTASFTEGTGLITFDGTGVQTVSNASGETFSRIRIDKPSGSVLLQNDVRLTNTTTTALTFANGTIRTSSSALLILNDNVNTTGVNTTSYVDGPMRKIGNDAFVFPVGKAGRLGLIGITNLAGVSTSSYFTAEYFATPHANLNVTPLLSHVSHAEYWTLTKDASAGSARVQLYWQDAFSDISNFGDLTVATFTGAIWTDAVKTATGGVVAGPGSVTSASTNTFQAFTFASLGGINILPIELLYFRVKAHKHHVEATWETASELNNDYFIVERSVDGETFHPVGNPVKGKGTTRERSSYSASDPAPLYGRSYYRLKQTDFDGTTAYSDIAAVHYDTPEFPVFSVYPNPGDGHSTTLLMEGFTPGTTVPYTLLDVSGNIVLQGMITVPAGRKEIHFPFVKKLATGTYIVRIGLAAPKKLVVN